MSTKLKNKRENSIEDLDFGLISINTENEVTFKDHEQGLDRGIVYVEVDKLKPAPNEWNFFSNLSVEEYEELKENIKKNGLSHPIVIYQSSKFGLMIISGHNRVNIYKELSPDNPYKYRTIPCIVETENSLSELDIQEKIIDLNILNRKLSKMDISKTIYHKWKIQKERSARGDGKVSDLIGKELNLSARHIYRYKSLFFLIDEFQSMINDETMSVESGAKLAVLDKDIQKWIFDNFSDKLTYNYLKRLHGAMNKESIEAIFNTTTKKQTSVKYNVPTHLKSEFDEYVKKWFGEKGLSVSKR